MIQETGGFEKTSTLVLTQARPEDSGPFMCVSQNQAGRVEANFTLQVTCFVMYVLLTSISIFTVHSLIRGVLMQSLLHRS